MKTFWTLFTALFLTVGVVDIAEAKRFGSGGFGKKATPMQQRQAAPTQQKQDSTQAQKPASSAGKGMMGGMLGGLLAGGLLAYMFGSGAFEGIQFMDILLIALVVGGLIFFLRRRAQTAQQPAYAGSDAQPQQRQSFDMGSFGGAASTAATTETPVIDLPEGFDSNAFLQGALEHYRGVQQAWNSGDLDVISEYVKPELFAELANARNAMTEAPNSQILDLEAEIVAAGRLGNIAEISILFRGRVNENGVEEGIFDLWHLERDVSRSNAPWLIAGIETE